MLEPYLSQEFLLRGELLELSGEAREPGKLGGGGVVAHDEFLNGLVLRLRNAICDGRDHGGRG